MKSQHNIALCLVSATFVAACSNQGVPDAMSTAKTISAELCKTGDPGIMQKYASQASQAYAAEIVKRADNPEEKAKFKESVQGTCALEFVKASVEGNDALITTKKGDSTGFIQLRLENNEWKLVLSQ